MNRAENGDSGQNLQALMDKGLRAHQAGQLTKAEAAYRQVLGLDATHADANHLLGVIALQTGDHGAAVELITKAIAANPDFAEAHSNKGIALVRLERPDEAITSYRRAIDIRPDYAEAHFNLGNALNDTGHPDGAIESYRQAIAVKPDYADAHHNLGNVLRDRDQPEDAAESYRRAIDIRPDYAEAYNNLGTVVRRLDRLDDALACHRKAISLNPDMDSAHNNLGLALQEQEKAQEALDSFRKALTINPDSVKALANLGNILKDLGRMDEAVTEYGKALAAHPDYAEIHYNLGLVYLLMGDFNNGWREYDWRWRKQDFSSQRAENDKPLWDGGDLGGKRLLVWSEQGVGDELLFAGLIPDLIERGIDVIIDSDPRLVPLFARSFPSATCIAKGDTNQVFDFHIPSGGLGRFLRPSFDSFPEPAPYLVADPDLRTELRNRYRDQQTAPLIGLSWYSDSPDFGRQSSLTLAQLRPLLETPEVTFVDLQYGDTADQRSAFARETGIDIVHDDRVDQRTDLDAFAAQVAAMDLVVSIDNSTPHLAGALGVPTWGLLRTVPYWCWGLDRDDSSWHPSMRLFRQDTPGDWNGVLERVYRALGDWSESRRN